MPRRTIAQAGERGRLLQHRRKGDELVARRGRPHDFADAIRRIAKGGSAMDPAVVAVLAADVRGSV